MQRQICLAVLATWLLCEATFGQYLAIPIEGKSLETLVRELTDEDEKVRKKACESLDRELIQFNDQFMKRLGQLRRELRPLAPTLIAQLRNSDESVVGCASALLMGLGPDRESAKLLERFVVDESRPSETQWLALTTLFYLTPEDVPVGPALLKLLNTLPKEMIKEHEDYLAAQPEEERWNGVGFAIPLCAGPLLNSGHTTVEVPYLVQIASGKFLTAFRLLAIATLGEMEEDAKPAVPVLRKLLRDEQPIIRQVAAYSLLQIEKDPKQVTELVQILGWTGKERTRFEEMAELILHEDDQTIERFKNGDQSEDETVAYINMLKHGNGVVKRGILRLLAKLGPAVASAKPAVREALNDPNEDTRKLAAMALKSIESEK
ncbi:MAG: HEAT repeat domain-containing protein [Planctomycetaceae bacterium]|nr:HEAT repeat domain-containing protein [Planctomycetaceae bacterium]